MGTQIKGETKNIMICVCWYFERNEHNEHEHIKVLFFLSSNELIHAILIRSVC